MKRQSSAEDHYESLQPIVTTRDFSEKVLAGAKGFGRGKFDDIERLILAVGASFVAPLLEEVATDVNRANRLFYLKVLQQLDSKVVIRQATQHLNDSRWFYVRNIIYTLRSIQDREAMPYIKPLSEHPHPKVRNEALRACLYYGCDDAIDNLLLMLDDKNPDTVNMAISLAAMIKNEQVAGKLVSMLRHNPVINYRLDHKKNIVKTLAKISPKGALPYFFDLLSMKNTLHPKQHKELTKEIIKVLQRYDRATLKPILSKYLPKVNTDLRGSLQLIYQRMED
jgi:HEAT repeat protein